ncbi:unnamed protein product [Caenorhabditis sp. 36 PRJEB53466]|nr:unnamed protein product [Caenorhabditis sp. 36 PRJEB53466]
MPTVQWVQLEARTQIVCGLISALTNAFLMYLIVSKSPPKLGGYKWLMLYTTVFEFFYAFVNLLAGPTVHTYESAFTVLQDMRNFYFDHSAAEFLVYTYCSCFGFSMAIFGGHFIYRYGAINVNFHQRYLSGAGQLLLYIFPFFYGILWGVICWLCYGETPERSSYLRETVKENYRLEIEECAYISAHFWPLDTEGTMYPDPSSFFGVSLMWIILGTSLFSVISFGFRCYRWITEKLESTNTQSELMRSLQTQLFYALLVQSAIPIVLMYMPAAMVFVFPMLNIELGLKNPFIGITIAIYPAIDPLPTILIIKSYRRGCSEVLRSVMCRSRHRISDSSTHSNVLSSLNNKH